MTNLLAIYTVLFLVTVAVGVELGFWFSRRKFVDVTESYEDLRLANARSDITHWKRLWKRLDSFPPAAATDLSGVSEQIDRVEHQLVVLSQRMNSLPEPQPTDLSHVYSQLNKIVDRLNGLRRQPVLKLDNTGEFERDLDDTDQLPALQLGGNGEASARVE